MSNRWLTIKQLDQQLKEWQVVSRKYSRPRAGWVKTLRLAFSMSAEQLAKRLGLTRSRITQLENAEIHDAVTLRTLKDTADAMGCELVYAIIPKNNSTVESIIKTQAAQIAAERVARVAHSMSLEAQSVNANDLEKQKEVIAKSLTEHLNKKFWTLAEKPNLHIQKEKLSALKKTLICAQTMKEKKKDTTNKEDGRKGVIKHSKRKNTNEA